MTQAEIVQAQQPQEEPVQPTPVLSQETPETPPPQEESRGEFVDMFSQMFGIPKEVVVKALNKEESLQRAQALLQLMQQLSQLPKEMRKALAPLVAGMVSGDDDAELKRLAKWMAVMRALNDPTSKLFIELLLEERKRTYELQQQLLQLILEKNAKNGAQKEEVQRLMQQVAKDPLDDLAERLEKLQKAAQILGFQRSAAEEKPKTVFDAVEEITKLADTLRKFGFDVKPAVVEQELKRIREEAYRQGLQDGVKKTEQFTELAKTALEKLGPSLNKLLDALADVLKSKQLQTV
jgi:DNA-binding transcriptional ArsR family regulator